MQTFDKWALPQKPRHLKEIIERHPFFKLVTGIYHIFYIFVFLTSDLKRLLRKTIVYCSTYCSHFQVPQSHTRYQVHMTLISTTFATYLLPRGPWYLGTHRYCKWPGTDFLMWLNTQTGCHWMWDERWIIIDMHSVVQPWILLYTDPLKIRFYFDHAINITLLGTLRILCSVWHICIRSA